MILEAVVIILREVLEASLLISLLLVVSHVLGLEGPDGCYPPRRLVSLAPFFMPKILVGSASKWITRDKNCLTPRYNCLILDWNSTFICHLHRARCQ